MHQMLQKFFERLVTNYSTILYLSLPNLTASWMTVQSLYKVKIKFTAYCMYIGIVKYTPQVYD